MATLPMDRLSILRKKIEQQRKTVEALKRGGHVYADAERELQKMLQALTASEKVARPHADSDSP